MIGSEKQGVVTVLTPEAPLNADSVEEFGDAVQESVGEGLPLVVFDLSNVALVDSVGLEAILDARDTVRGRGGVVKLAGLTPLVGDIAEATGVAEHFEVFPSAKAAVGSFSR